MMLLAELCCIQLVPEMIDRSTYEVDCSGALLLCFYESLFLHGIGIESK